MNKNLELLAGALGVLGFALWVIAWLRAGNTANPKVASRAQVLGGLAGGILTGAAVTVGVLLLQQWLAASSSDALWRANVETAASIPGFTPDEHSMQGLDLSGKQLQDADLRGRNLTDVQFRDTNLTGAVLSHADFRGDVMYSANLSNTDLTGADLSDASIQGVQFEHAYIYRVKSLWGATADAATCWPPGFFTWPISKEIKATAYHDQNGRVWPPSPGRVYGHCLPNP